MKYILKVWLCGGLSNDYIQPLSKITLCVHCFCEGKADKHFTDQFVMEPDTKRQDNDLPKKVLAASGSTDTRGKIDLQLNNRYLGGTFEVSILFKKHEQKKNQYLHLATLTPSWHRHGNVFLTAWNYCLLPRSSNQLKNSKVAGYPMRLFFPGAGKQMRTSVPTPGLE